MKKITEKDLVPGHKYLSSDEQEVVYLGYFTTYLTERRIDPNGKYEWSTMTVVTENKYHWFNMGDYNTHLLDLRLLVSKISDVVDFNYENYINELEYNSMIHKEDISKFKYVRNFAELNGTQNYSYKYKYINYGGEWFYVKIRSLDGVYCLLLTDPNNRDDVKHTIKMESQKAAKEWRKDHYHKQVKYLTNGKIKKY